MKEAKKILKRLISKIKPWVTPLPHTSAGQPLYLTKDFDKVYEAQTITDESKVSLFVERNVLDATKYVWGMREGPAILYVVANGHVLKCSSQVSAVRFVHKILNGEEPKFKFLADVKIAGVQGYTPYIILNVADVSPTLEYCYTAYSIDGLLPSSYYHTFLYEGSLLNGNRRATYFGSTERVEITHLPSALYGTTTASGSLADFVRTRWLACGDGDDYYGQELDIYQLREDGANLPDDLLVRNVWYWQHKSKNLLQTLLKLNDKL